MYLNLLSNTFILVLAVDFSLGIAASGLGFWAFLFVRLTFLMSEIIFQVVLEDASLLIQPIQSQYFFPFSILLDICGL